MLDIKLALRPSNLNGGKEGRAVFTSTKFGKLVVVVGSNVYLATVNYSQQLRRVSL